MKAGTRAPPTFAAIHSPPITSTRRRNLQAAAPAAHSNRSRRAAAPRCARFSRSRKFCRLECEFWVKAVEKTLEMRHCRGSTCIVQPALQAAGQNGQLRRVATRYVLSRSVSECHDDAAAAHLLAEALGHANAGISLLDEEVVSMEDLTVAAVGGGGSTLSVCVEGDETAAEHEQAAAAAIEDDDDDASSAGSSSNDDAAASSAVRGGRSTLFEQRKKRVSFNDRVQARIYRSTSSIVGAFHFEVARIRASRGHQPAIFICGAPIKKSNKFLQPTKTRPSAKRAIVDVVAPTRRAAAKATRPAKRKRKRQPAIIRRRHHRNAATCPPNFPPTFRQVCLTLGAPKKNPTRPRLRTQTATSWRNSVRRSLKRSLRQREAVKVCTRRSAPRSHALTCCSFAHAGPNAS